MSALSLRSQPAHHLLALAISLATATHALAEDTPPPATLELGATQIDESFLGLGTTTEGSGSYTTGSMATATKLPLTMRETPQAVTVVTRQRMDDQAMTSVNDIVKATPGLFLSQSSGPGRQTYRARGFDIDNLMYDGIPSMYQGWTVGAQPNLAMFDRVEITRGATGLVTGSGNPSAAINFVRKRPLATPALTLTGAAGSWDDYRGEVDASSPLNDSNTLRGRVVASWQDANNFRDDVDEQHGLFYAVGDADLSDDTTLTVGFSHQKDRNNFFWGGLPIGNDGHHLDLPRSTNPGTDWEDKDQVIDTLFAEVRHQLANDWSLQVNASRSMQDGLFSGSYQSRYGGPLARTVYQSRQKENQTGLDAFVSGPFELLGRTHELVVGASKRIYDMTTRNYSPYATNWPLIGPKPPFTHTENVREVTTQDGVYATTRLSLADPLKLILGGRLDWYDYDNKDDDSDFKVTRNVTRYAGLIYDLDAYHSVYVSYSDIFNPQNAKDISGSVLTPIKGKNYEIGIKGEYFDGALNASAAVFRIDQENRATLADDQSGCPQMQCYDASGMVRSQGIDLEVQGALTPQWQVGAGLTYARVRIEKDAENPDKVHKPFESETPERLFKLTTSYQFQGQLEKLRVGGSVYWQSRMYDDIPLADGSNYRLEQGAYAITDLMAGYALSEHVDLQLNANNIFDRRYYSAIGSSVVWGSTDTYGNPRNLMLTAKYSF